MESNQIKEMELEEFANFSANIMINGIWKERLERFDGQLVEIENRIMSIVSGREISKDDILKYVKTVFNNLSNSDLFRNMDEIKEKLVHVFEQIQKKLI